MTRFKNPQKLTPGKNSNMTALLHCNGSTSSTAIIDECGTIVTLNGNATYTLNPVFGNAAVSVSSASIPYGYIGGSADAVQFGANDFTVEFRVYPQVLPPAGYMFTAGSTSSAGSYQTLALTLVEAGYVGAFLSTGNSWIQVTSSASGIKLSTSRYYDVALTRNGSVFTLWIDGNSVGTVSSTQTLKVPTSGWSVGSEFGSTASQYATTAYYDEIAIWNGLCKYTNNYAPARTAYY